MADYLSAELTATCAVIGYFDGTTYHLDKNCLGDDLFILILILF